MHGEFVTVFLYAKRRYVGSGFERARAHAGWPIGETLCRPAAIWWQHFNSDVQVAFDTLHHDAARRQPPDQAGELAQPAAPAITHLHMAVPHSLAGLPRLLSLAGALRKTYSVV